MNNKESKRIIKSRQSFTELSKSEINKWKRIKEIKDKKRLEELQNIEIEKINKKLIELRDEYKRISCERGSAHKWALIVGKQELDSKEFNKRLNNKVLIRSKHTFNDFINENIEKQNNIKIEKQNKLLKRKELMKSSINNDILVNNEDIEGLNALKQLKSLQKSENVLREMIRKKKNLSHSEESIERQTQKLLWAKKLVPNQEFLYSSVSSIDSQQNLIPNEDKTIDSKSIIKSQELNNKKDFIETKFDENNVESNEYLPISIATKLYERLKSYEMTTNDKKSEKVYRNAAINTTINKNNSLKSSVKLNNDSNSFDQSFGDLSRQTSYLSVPTALQMPSNRATIGLSELYKNHLLNKRSNSMKNKSSVQTIDLELDSLQDLTIVDDSDNSVDPLIARINNLKKLIESKVGSNANFKESDHNLSAGDINQIISNSKSINILHSIEESLNGEQNQQISEIDFDERNDNFDAISSSSSTTFKTLQAISTSDLSVPLVESSFQETDHRNRRMPSIESNSFELQSNSGIESMASSMSLSFMCSEPIRERNAFWRDVFDRAGIEMDTKKLDDILPMIESDSEISPQSFSSFSINSFSTALHSHSTPKP